MEADSPRVEDVLARIRVILHGGPRSFYEDVRDVIVIGSSSRGGSSIFAEMLRRNANLLHFQAEVNPFFVLSGLGFPQSGTRSDALDASHARIVAGLGGECGQPATSLPEGADTLAFATDLTCRLCLQWPHLAFTLDDIHTRVVDTLRTLRARHGWGPAELRDIQLFHAHLYAGLPDVNPYDYDIDRALVAAVCPDARPSRGPAGPFVIEEPPFVTIRPWHRASSEALATLPVVMKTPSNAYRLPFLRALFPNARVRVLHLTRNVAASVNGLYDGWRFPGFHSHRLPVELDIAGYDDRHWWKFDLPPGWEAWTRRPLEEVCAFQWRSAHDALLGFEGERMSLRFEDVIGPGRDAAFRRLSDWLGVPVAGVDLPPVMATERPRERRWFARAGLLEPVLTDPANRATMERLGYEQDPISWI